MALLSELVKAVADVEGIDQVSVGIFARTAREAGLISQKGRGRGAAHMSVHDAANLLIAVNGSPLAKNVPALVPLFQKLKTPPDIDLPPDLDDAVSDVLRADTFGDVLEGLIRLSRPEENGRSALERCLLSSADAEYASSRDVDLPYPCLEVEFGQPYVEASIKAAKIKINRGRYHKASLIDLLSINYVSDVDAPKRLKCKDRQIRTSITEATLLRVAELELRDDDR